MEMHQRNLGDTMSNFGLAQLCIGGAISKKLLPQLITLIHNELLLVDKNGQPVDKNSINIQDYVHDGALILTSDEESFDAFDDIEDWLMEHDMPFTKDSESFIQDDGTKSPHQTSFWLPGMEDKRFIINDTERTHMVHVGEIEFVLAAIKAVGSIEEAPKFINSKNYMEKGYAEYILQEGYADPIEYIQCYLKKFYHEPDLPNFEVL